MREYIVSLKTNPMEHWYSIEAPSKRIAKWCAFNIFQNEYSFCVSVKDFEAIRISSTKRNK